MAPEWPFLLVLVVLWMGICLGVGWVGELLHRARRQASAVAFLDPLTGLPNRGHLRLFLDFTFGAAERGGYLTIVIFDLDNFKRVNDAHGHAAGDETLVAFAEVLRAHTRRADLSARFGGEEFVCVLTGAGDAAGAKIFAERVRESLRTLPFPWVPVTVSVGIASYRQGVSTPELVLAEADRALYAAKRDGRDRIVIAAGEGGDAVRLAGGVARSAP
jgi:diguanylate cyclase (GGDEF)-like protein